MACERRKCGNKKYWYGMTKDEFLAVCKQRIRFVGYGIVHQAVKWGVVKKLPCQVCGDQFSCAHHFDYNTPLDVIWLCPSHHATEHNILGIGKRNVGVSTWLQEYLRKETSVTNTP